MEKIIKTYTMHSMKTENFITYVCLPKIGESITEGSIVAWLKKPGDFVEKDEPLVEISTDKINSEIPSAEEGILQEIFKKPGERVAVGEKMCSLTKGKKKETDVSFFSPAVLRIAKERGIEKEVLKKLPPTGENGRLTKKDLELHLEKKSTLTGNYEEEKRIVMTPLRQTIAKNMVRSFYQAPHASLVIEVDVTNIVKSIKKQKERFLEKYGSKLTITSFVAVAMAKAVHSYPLINASLENDTILLKKFVHLGIAVSVDEGVMVPVIRQAEKLSLSEMSQKIANLAEKSRASKLHPDDTQNGSITLTNFGIAKAKIGIPIIRFPEVAILGMGAIEKKVVALQDDTIGIRSMMHLSLTFDHRVLDGLYGCGFLAEIKQQLEQQEFFDSDIKNL